MAEPWTTTNTRPSESGVLDPAQSQARWHSATYVGLSMHVLSPKVNNLYIPHVGSATSTTAHDIRYLVEDLPTSETKTSSSALRRAVRVCSSACTLVSVLNLSAVVRVRVCVCVCVQNLHYRGIFLNSAGPALLRALSVPRDFTCAISGTCTIQSALYRAQYYVGAMPTYCLEVLNKEQRLLSCCCLFNVSYILFPVAFN